MINQDRYILAVPDPVTSPAHYTAPHNCQSLGSADSFFSLAVAAIQAGCQGGCVLIIRLTVKFLSTVVM